MSLRFSLKSLFILLTVVGIVYGGLTAARSYFCSYIILADMTFDEAQPAKEVRAFSVGHEQVRVYPENNATVVSIVSFGPYGDYRKRLRDVEAKIDKHAAATTGDFHGRLEVGVASGLYRMNGGSWTMQFESRKQWEEYRARFGERNWERGRQRPAE